MGDVQSRLRVRLQPNARRSEVLGFQYGVLRVRVTAPPHEGRANKALIELLSDTLDVPKSRIEIVHGHTARDKLVAIEGMDAGQVEARLSTGA